MLCVCCCLLFIVWSFCSSFSAFGYCVLFGVYVSLLFVVCRCWFCVVCCLVVGVCCVLTCVACSQLFAL